MPLNEMKRLIESIKSMKDAEQSLMFVGGEQAEMELQSLRMSINNLERLAAKALDKNA